jgi:MFS family permease
MAMFVVVPFAIIESSQLHENQHWMIYLPVLLVSFVLMVPAIIYAEKQAKVKAVFIGAIALMLIAQIAFAFSITLFWGIVVSLGLYFVAFNILEASLPSIISKVAPAAAKGTAIGVYNTAQSLGIFVGGVLGGFLSHHYGFASVFIFCSVMIFLWLLLAVSMKAPAAVRTKMFSMPNTNTVLSVKDSETLRLKLAKLAGVVEAVVLPDEHTVILKVDKLHTWDEAHVFEVHQLLRG